VLSRLSELVLPYSVERMSAQVLLAATEVTVATARPPWGVVGRGYRLPREAALAGAAGAA